MQAICLSPIYSSGGSVDWDGVLGGSLAWDFDHKVVRALNLEGGVRNGLGISFRWMDGERW